MTTHTETKALVERLLAKADEMDAGGLIAARTGTDNEVCPDACDDYAYTLRQAAAALEPLTREPDADEVEGVARALWNSEWPTWPEGYTANRETLHIRARAAIAALPRRDAMREALEWIEYHYANQDMSHVDFRVEAYTRARAALTEEPGHGG